MNPVSHFLIGWGVANTADLNRRERVAVTVAGIIPDIDSLGIIAEKLTLDSDRPLLWWTEYHHVLGHNIGFALLVTAAAFALAARRRLVAGLAFLSFHLHLLGDIVGARGPDGDQWPIPYLLPFSRVWKVTWSGQWYLNAWPNIVITLAMLALVFYLAWKRGYSPLEMFSAKADRAFVKALRDRFGWPQPNRL